MDANDSLADDDYGGYDEYWRFDEVEDIGIHAEEDLGTHPLFRHWRSLDRVFWAPLWHEDGRGCEAVEAAYSQLTKWGAPTSSTGTHVAAMGYQLAALDGCILLRNPRDASTEKGDIEGALVIGQQLLRLVADIDKQESPNLPGEGAAGRSSIEDLKRILAWQLEFRRPALEARLERVRFVQKCEDANSIGGEFDAQSADVWPSSPVGDHLELVEDLGDISVHQAMTVRERFDAARAHLYSDGDDLHASANCPNARPGHGRTEGDPVGGPVAMRLWVGGSGASVGRTRLG